MHVFEPRVLTSSLFIFLCLQRDVKSDPIAVRQVVTATNDLLESLGSLAVEVGSSPSSPPVFTRKSKKNIK